METWNEVMGSALPGIIQQEHKGDFYLVPRLRREEAIHLLIYSLSMPSLHT
jgi:hypothetical protein